MSKAKNVYGTGLLLGSTGVLLRGPSGAGKSVLALTLLDRWALRGLPAFLVSDDRVDLIKTDERVTMHTPNNLAGLIELRGRGIVSRSHQSSVSLDLVIDMVPDIVRMVEEDEFETELVGVSLARAPVPFGNVISLGHQVLLVAEAMSALNQP
ncbi:MAG: hypothetical protein MO846_08225 [Candidatus Devosia symbiotica]|nr:hypothetical protein [Candidatus Devosia symbiotica]